ncbi:hypothetical protein O0L34_g8753 [Tuta absoluta]|nr:hypothetical protein O0L34_g8753 [Tuta absoluta]
MVGTDTDSWSVEDTLRVLIASDIHLGAAEKDAVRGEDSFIAFEEVLSLAVQCDVDLILLGGDLFDQAKPSPQCLFKATQLIRKYCFGDKPVAVELLSDQLENFSRSVNYEDPNLNVAYPILSIHGNHDDPVGEGSVSSLDILSITGLVNYFGKWSDYTHVRISPVLMQKGATRLALYGLSHLKDQRLSRLFVEKKVEMELPEDGESWFNLLVLHQNRADRGPGNYIPEKVLPKFLDLVVWGHEHDSLVFPIKGKTESDEFTVLQPGSTVATSLAAGEALPKHCALLQIHKNEYSVTPIPLKTVRPFIFKTVVLSEETMGEDEVNESANVIEFLKSKVNEAIEEAERKRSGDPKQPTLPLVRLNVMYEKECQNFNKMRFGQNFNGMVANPTDIINMKKEKKIRDRKPKEIENGDLHIEGAAEAADVEELVRNYYAALPIEKRLQVLSVRSMNDATGDFCIKKDDEIFKRVFEAHKRRCVEMLLESNAETEEEVLERLRQGKQELDVADEDQLKKLIDAAASKPPTPGALKRAIVVLDSDDESEVAATTRGRGRGARGGARGGRGRGRNARAKPEPEPEPSPVPERRTPRRAAQKSASWLQNFAERSSRNRGSIDIDDSD